MQPSGPDSCRYPVSLTDPKPRVILSPVAEGGRGHQSYLSYPEGSEDDREHGCEEISVLDLSVVDHDRSDVKHERKHPEGDALAVAESRSSDQAALSSSIEGALKAASQT